MTNYKKVLGATAILGALAMGGTAFAQTTTTTTTDASTTVAPTTVTPTDSSTTVTPTAPNTGAGGDAAQNYALLGVTGLIAAAGVTYLARGKKVNA